MTALRQAEKQAINEEKSKFPLGLFWLLITGVGVIFIGITVMVIASFFGPEFSGGGVIFIGPVPIVFGTGPDSGLLIVISLILAITMLVLILIMRRSRKFGD